MSVIKNLGKLSKPEDFIKHYFAEIKTWLNNKDLILSKFGYLGSFLHVLGNLSHDVKYYYDYLFRESFPITSMDNKNLIYHSNLYGYKLKLADPAYLNGQFEFIFDSIPTPSLSIYKRQITLQNIVIKIDNINFNLDATYKIFQIKDGNSWNYIVDITRDSEFLKIPVSEPNMYCDIYDLIQYDIVEYEIPISSYVRGSFYKQSLTTLTDDFIYKIEASVKLLENSTFDLFETMYSKEFTSGDDKVIFININDNNELTFEAGNGIKGIYIPLSTVKLKVYKTKGSNGNVKNTINSQITGRLSIIDFDANSNIISAGESLLVPVGSFVKLNNIEGYGGTDADNNETLRNNLITYIQSRENILSETDFYNLLNKYFPIYELIFKKTSLIDNIFYIYHPIFNKFYNSIYTTTSTISKLEFEENLYESDEIKYVYKPKKIINGKTFISPFLYIYNQLLNYYEG